MSPRGKASASPAPAKARVETYPEANTREREVAVVGYVGLLENAGRISGVDPGMGD